MADTSIKEYTAEDLITYKLHRSGILVAKPRFDTDATDLFAMLRVQSDSGFTYKYCRIQCKYRSLVEPINKSNRIEIDKRYIEEGGGDLIVFLYVEDGNIAENHLFCFFWEDVVVPKTSPWRRGRGKRGDVYRLCITTRNFKRKLANYVFDEKKAGKIKQRIDASRVTIQPIICCGQIDITDISREALIRAATKKPNGT